SKYLKEIEREEIRAIFEKLKQPGINGPNGIVTVPSGLFSDPRRFVITKDSLSSFLEADSQGNPAVVSNEAEFKKVYNKSIRFVSRVVNEFVKFLWQDPYARAWLVITANGNDDLDVLARDSDNWRFNE